MIYEYSYCLFPFQLHDYLNDYVIGQDRAKKVLSLIIFPKIQITILFTL